MSFNAAALEAFRDKGLSLDDVIEILEAMEGGPRPAPRPVKQEGDRRRRLSSAERRTVYSVLCDRDGETCGECQCGASTIWRRNGVTASEEGWQYTTVYPTSNLEVDHRDPLWAGGSNSPENLWLLCVQCHKAKTAQEASQRRRA